MIQELTIANYALIDQARLRFSSGLNVLSGETGAGKSILIGALGLLLGAKAEADIIRAGAEEAQVAGVFSIDPPQELRDWFEANQLSWPEEDGLILRRSVRPQKRGGAMCSGQPVTRVQLEELTSFLVDLHGQHEHQSLFTTDQHRRLLDQYAGLSEELRAFGEQFQALTSQKRALEELIRSEAGREEEVFRLQQLIQDVQRLDWKEDEEEALKTERRLLEQYSKLHEALNSVEQALLDGRSAALGQLRTAHQALAQVSQIDAQWQSEETRLETALLEVEDIAETLHRYHLGLSYRPERLEEIQERLALIHAVDKKYGPGWGTVQERLSQALLRLNRLENYSSERAKAEAQVQQAEKDLIQAAMGLSERRQAAASRLEVEVRTALAELGMPAAVFKIGFQRKLAESGKPLCGMTGIDSIEFLLSANVGESPKPLRETASGGELSRVMLALKTILSEADKIPILIFDEIDTGIGGEIGNALGKFLQRLARQKQVLCITHLASIASFADCHLKVEKLSTEGRTLTKVEEVTGPDRVREIARMLSGNTVSEASLQHAEELIEQNSARG